MLTKKAEAAIKAYVKRTPQSDLAMAKVLGSGKETHQGPARLLPVLGWVRKEKGVPYLTLSCLILRVYDDKHIGTMAWTLPLNERTERAACTVLTSIGWDGRIWPVDAGWPDGEQEATGLKQLLFESHIFASFVFPPEAEKGNRVLRIEIGKTNVPFPLEPAVPADDIVEPTPEQLTRLHMLALDPDIFLRTPLK